MMTEHFDAALKAYFTALVGVNLGEATEHTLRTPLEVLLKAVAAKTPLRATVIHEPRRDKSGLGAPDFKIKHNEAIIGYLETKKIGEDLSATLKSEQLKKYKKLSGNIIVTNYVEWVWLRDGQTVKKAALCPMSDVGRRTAKISPDNAAQVAEMLTKFLSMPPAQLGDAKKLAEALAVRCHELREFLIIDLERQQFNGRSSGRKKEKLYGLFQVFRGKVFANLGIDEFADTFAQTLGYGLFLAKLNPALEGEVTLNNAKAYISGNFALIQEMVGFLDELEKPEYANIKWLLEEILSIINTLDMAVLYEHLSFANARRIAKGGDESDAERALFAKDPYVYFYEDFLKAYDKKKRKSRGVYYTPPPVVNFIIRAINDILRDTFKIKDGLASHKKVTVLDFATGTGTFLLEILQQIFDATPKAKHKKLVHEHVLKNFYGFEYLMAPYVVAHMKLSQFLRDKGHIMAEKERLHIYLTNTLEPVDAEITPLLSALSDEVEGANEIKEQPILVITGNPPYAGHSSNQGEWIRELIEDYKSIDKERLNERNTKWLQDDYVKFIRFAQWKMEQVKEGVVGIITNHSFLDNPTFRGMRHSLMQTFNEVYVLDLHGNVKKNEVPPKGDRDENVFDIEQGVAISLFIKKPGLEKGVFHADLWGERQKKYHALMDATRKTGFKKLKVTAPFYLFRPQDTKLRGQYEKGWSVTDIFPENSVGIVTARDNLTIQYSKKEIEEIVKDFPYLPPEEARRKYALPADVRDWKVADAQKDLQDDAGRIVPIAYRLYDNRYTCYTGRSRGFHCMPRDKIMRHFVEKDNIGLVTVRQVKTGDEWRHCCSTRNIMESTYLSNRTSEISYLFPLYLHPAEKNGSNGELAMKELETPYGKIANINPDFWKAVTRQYGDKPTPEAIFGYVYAVLHSPAWRGKYKEFLKIDFPRIPLVKDAEQFKALSKIGWRLMQAHTLEKVTAAGKAQASGKGEFEVKRVDYDDAKRRLYINDTQYFAKISPAVWAHRIGSYNTLQQYLEARKGRRLSLDEVNTVEQIAASLHDTLTQMQRVDEVLVL